MRSLFSVAGVVVIVLLLFVALFFVTAAFFQSQVNVGGVTQTATSSSGSKASSVSIHATSTGATGSAPSGFQGPTSQPHIIGPTGNPPNY